MALRVPRRFADLRDAPSSSANAVLKYDENSALEARRLRMADLGIWVGESAPEENLRVTYDAWLADGAGYWSWVSVAAETYAASGASTLDAVTGDASCTFAGTFASAGESTLGACTGSAVAAFVEADSYAASGAAALAAVTGDASCTFEATFAAEGASTLGACTGSASGTFTEADSYAATGASTIAAATGAASGAYDAMAYAATGAATIAAATGAASCAFTEAAAISLVGTGSVVFGDIDITSMVVGMPSDTADGDVLVIAVHHTSWFASDVTTPSGWTAASTGSGLRVFYKVRSGAPSSVTINQQVTDGCAAAVCVAFRGLNATPLREAGTIVTNKAPGGLSTSSGDLVLMVVGAIGNAAPGTPSSLSGVATTLGPNSVSGGLNFDGYNFVYARLAISYGTASGSAGTGGYSQTNTDVLCKSQQVAFKP